MSQPRIAIIGAGLAGLSAAKVLNAHDISVDIFEATESIGGRVKSRNIDGFILDEGFQVFNPAYSTAQTLLDYDTLQLRRFDAGVTVMSDDGDVVLTNPLQNPALIPRMLARLPYPKDFARFIAYSLSTLRTTTQENKTAYEALQAAGISERFIWQILNPFLQGVFLDFSLSTSKQFLDFVLKYFVLGRPAVPALGMGQIPYNLAASFPTSHIFLNTPVEHISDTSITTHMGTDKYDKIIVATDSDFVAKHFHVHTPSFHSVTTWYHTTSGARNELAHGRGLLRVDSQSTRGPVINTVVLSHVSSSYSPAGQHLISSSTLLSDQSIEMERAVRGHLSYLYATNTDDWALIDSIHIPKALNISPVTPTEVGSLGENIFLAGDWTSSTSIEGAMASGVKVASLLLNEMGRHK